MDPKREETGSEAKPCENRGRGWSGQGTPEPKEARKLGRGKKRLFLRA